jgi:2,3-dihydroxybiphenyl 1,2-dioxygenase
MHHQLELGYLVLEVPEPDSLDTVFADVIGLVPGEPTATGARTWRNDGRAYRLIVEPGPANDAVAVGFEAVDVRAFEGTVARLQAAGLPVTEDTSGVELRRVARLARTRAPWGTDVEVVLALADAPTQFSSALVPAGFLTDGVGLGHVVIATTAFDESAAFITDGLGFIQSDWLEMEIAEGIMLEVRFYHCNARHHTVALARAPFELPQVLHHVMFEVNDRDDVGAAFDRLWASELGIPNGLGRHDNDGMFSFYLQTPAGFLVEVGHGARIITEDWNDNRAYDAISAWGHQPLRQP